MMSNIIKTSEIIGVKLQMIRIISVRSCCAIVRAYVRLLNIYSHLKRDESSDFIIVFTIIFSYFWAADAHSYSGNSERYLTKKLNVNNDNDNNIKSE